MNEKKIIGITVIVMLCVIIASFGAGYAVGYRRTVQQIGQSDNEFRAELESEQRRVAELEAELVVIRSMVSNAFVGIGGAITRAEGRIEYAINEVDDIRETVGIIRAAVKDMENSLRYFRELVARLSNSEHNTGE